MSTQATREKLQSAMKLQLAGELDNAESIYQEVLASNPENFDALHLLGLIRCESDKMTEGVAMIEKAIQLQPRAPAFHHNIAGIYRRLGRLTEAESEFRKAIELKPDYGEAYQGLAEMVTFKPGDPFVDQILQQLGSGKISSSISSYFHFAAGKYFDDIAAYSDAFEHYVAGNRATQRKFSSEGFNQQVKDTLYVFSQEQIEYPNPVGYPGQQPVFIVGMPRSGTTLVEQIIASHSGVYGAGELIDMKVVAAKAAKISRTNAVYPNCVPGLSSRQLYELGEEYNARINKVAGGDFPRIIDKHPLNFIYIGLILLMLPHAKIIHTTRNPLDTCLSCFFQNFTQGQDYSFDLGALAGFYNDYKRLMSHWNQIFPERILNVAYESLLDNQEEETRRMLDYCELEFEENCLRFYETERTVKTASFRQVRKPIYHASRNRWRNYAPQLQGLAEMIGESVELPVTISAFSNLT